jgi:hypothetical protein
MLKSVVSIEGFTDRIDYKELEFDIHDEMSRYGNCIKVVVPRPPLFGDPTQTPGFGHAFVLFEKTEFSERAKQALFRRRLNGKPVDSIYFPEEKFNR